MKPHALPFLGSVFLENLHHAYAQTDGCYCFPNSREGDMLKRAKAEIEALTAKEQKLARAAREVLKTLKPHCSCNECNRIRLLRRLSIERKA